MTTEANNTELAKYLYERFVAQDIESILAAVDDNIVFTFKAPENVPLAGTFKGKEGVLKFFAGVSQLDYTVFNVHKYIAQGDEVLALLHGEGTAKPTGKAFVYEEPHLWQIKDGKVVSWQGFPDTAVLRDIFTA